jgi:small-conductance mechanosensitive channel
MNLFHDWFHHAVIFGNSLRQWSVAAILLVVAAVAFWFLRRFIRRRLLSAVRSADRTWIEVGLRVLRALKGWFLVLVTLYIASLPLSIPDDVRRFIRSVMTVAFFTQLAIWADIVLAHVIENRARRRLAVDAGSATTLQLLGFCARIVVWVIAVLLAMENLGINVTALMAGLGIGGIAVAFAAQSVLRDLFGSMSIMFDRPFVLGDFIAVGTTMGTIENIGLRTTRLRSLSGEIIVMSNDDLLQSRISNYRQLRDRRSVFVLGVSYDTPYEKLELIPRIVREAIEAQPATRFDRSHFKEYGPTSLVFESVFFYTSPNFNQYMDAQQAINLAIFRRFAEEGIPFATPTTKVVMRDRPSEEDVGEASDAAAPDSAANGPASDRAGGSRQGRLHEHVS